nr:capsid protein [Mute swan feces associated picobirnavirus B]
MRNNKNKFNKNNKVSNKGANTKTPSNNSSTENTSDDTSSNSTANTGGNKSTKPQTTMIFNPSWYDKDPQLLKDTGTFSFNGFAGTNIAFTNKNKLNVPGVAILDYVHGIPTDGDTGDIINVAARNFYSDVRKYNSGGANYDPNDMMLYLLAINEFYVLYMNVARAIGLTFSWDVYSKYQPKFLVEALGFSYDDISSRPSQWRALLNGARARLAHYATPKSMMFFDRQAKICSMVVRDSANRKAQYLAYRPYIYRVFADTERGSELHAKEYPYTGSSPKLATLEDMRKIFNEVIDAISGSDTTGNISGDIRKAFDPGEFWELPIINGDYITVPNTDYGVLSQMENAQLVGGPLSLSDLNMTEDNGLNKSTIVYKPKVSKTVVGGVVNPYINARTDDTNPYYIADVTRMKAFARREASDGGLYVDICGTEFITSITVFNKYWQMQVGSGVAGAKFAKPEGITEDVYQLVNGDIKVPELTRDEGMLVSRLIYMWATFNWLPTLWLGISEEADKPAEYYPLFDIDNYTVINDTELQALHETIALSLFGVESTK